VGLAQILLRLSAILDLRFKLRIALGQFCGSLPEVKPQPILSSSLPLFLFLSQAIANCRMNHPAASSGVSLCCHSGKPAGLIRNPRFPHSQE
jgi:hypothetical protein